MNLCVNVGKYILIANDVVGLLIVLVFRKAIPCPKAAIPIGLPCLQGIGSNPPGAAGGGLDEIDKGS